MPFGTFFLGAFRVESAKINTEAQKDHSLLYGEEDRTNRDISS